MCLDKKWLEWWVIIECAINDAWIAFKEIVFLATAAFMILVFTEAINLLFTLTLFIGVPLVYGLFWAVMYRRAFDTGELKIADFTDDKIRMITEATINVCTTAVCG